MSAESTTKPTPTPVTGDCVVCGQKTTTRCASCASKGRERMFFCSTKHQKLVWFVHKHVCGEKGNPFRWPSLSLKEVEDIMRLSNLPFGKNNVSMLDDTVRMAPILAQTSIETRKQYLRSSLTRLQVGNDKHTNPTNVEISAMRCAYMGVLLTSVTMNPHATPLDIFQLVADHPFDYLIHTEEVILKELTGKWSENGKKWWGTFQQKYLVHIATLVNLSRTRNDEARRLFKYTREELERFVSIVVASSHPIEAQRILNGIAKSDNEALSTLEEYDL